MSKITVQAKSERPLVRARAFSSENPPHLNDDGTIRQPDRIARVQWRDPEDTAAMERTKGRAHKKTVNGYRAIDPLTRLPCEPNHLTAASRLRADWEYGSGARGDGMGFRVDGNSRDNDTSAGPLEARRRYQNAVQALGQRASAFVLPLVLSGWTVADLVQEHGGNAMAVQGRVMAGLDRLAEHYFGERSVDFVVPFSPLVVDVGSDLPQERLGRFKRTPTPNVSVSNPS